MLRALKADFVLWACLLFVLVNGIAVANELYWFSLLPPALLCIWALIAHVDKLMLFVVFCTPLSINMEDLGGIGIYLPTEPLMVAIMLLFFLKLAMERNVFDARVWKHPVTWAICAHLIWIAVCCIPSTDPLVSIKFLTARLWFVVVMYFVVTRLFEDSANMQRFFWLYLVSLSVVVSYTLVNHAEHGFAQDPAHWVMSPFFKDHTSYGAILAFILPFAFTATTMPGWSRTKKGVAVVLLIIIATGLVFSYTRAAWVSLVAAIGVYLIMRIKVPAWLVGLGSVALLVGYLIYQDQLTMTLERNRDESSDDLAEHVSSISNISSDASNLERLNRWNSALRMFAEKPLFGFGPGTYMFEYAPYQASDERTIISTNFGSGGNAHSEYLGPLAEQGVLGMVLMVIIVAVVSNTAIRLWLRLPPGVDRRLVGAAFFGLVTYYVHGVLNNYLDTDKASVLFWGSTALIVVLDIKHPKASPIR
ncbi:MAG: O-antigen ligase family protein [Flavobacteriales bacterium]|nr:MAG: O-antigen ligase family protein [Flavobacteriales bacterium]